jgi:hypothetical protein
VDADGFYAGGSCRCLGTLSCRMQLVWDNSSTQLSLYIGTKSHRLHLFRGQKIISKNIQQRVFAAGHPRNY